MFPGPERPDPRGFGGRDLGAGRYADRRLGERSPSPSGSLSVIAIIRSHSSSAIAGRPTTDREVVIGQGAIDAAIRRLTPAARIPAWSGALYAADPRFVSIGCHA